MRRLFHWTHCISCNARSGLSGVLLLAVLLGSLGIPIWPPVAKDLSSPFPCQHHSCGCHDAKSCWKSCCCFSHDEKVAWAAKHNVAVPEYAQDRSPKVAARAGVAKSSGKTCCHQGGTCGGSDGVETATNKDFDFSLITIEDAHRCQTGEALIVILGQALPPQVPAAEPAFTLIVGFVPPATLAANSLAQCPAIPPPRA